MENTKVTISETQTLISDSDTESNAISEENSNSKKCKKITTCLCILQALLILIIFVLYIIIINSNELPPGIGYPPENTKNHSLGNCYIYDDCVVLQKNNTVELVPKIKYKLPNQYKTDVYGTNCPSYWEKNAAPTYYYMRKYCKDLGYGCCQLKLNPECSIRIKFSHHLSKEENARIYQIHLKTLSNYYIDIAKEDKNGTNCPTYDKLLKEPQYNIASIEKKGKELLALLVLIYAIYSLWFCSYFIKN